MGTKDTPSQPHPTPQPQSRSLRPSQAARLLALAGKTKRKIHWDWNVRDATHRWAWRENARTFSIYTKQDPVKETSFAVLATGVIKGTVGEVASLLVADSQYHYEQKMAALYEKQFKHGMYVCEVEPEDLNNSKVNNNASMVSVRSATFTTPGWLHKDVEWCYLDTTTYNPDEEKLEVILTTLEPEPLEPRNKLRSTSVVRDMICGFRVVQDVPDTVNGEPIAYVRVHFYGEITSPLPTNSNRLWSRLSRPETSTEPARQRLFQLARACGRLSSLVRRRRLGAQVLIDRRVVLPFAMPDCFTCDKLQVVGKFCRVCGQRTCADCSAKYEREVSTKGGPAFVERVRVCDTCLARVESADYSNIHSSLLRQTVVAADTIQPMPPSDLKALLRDALLEAPSPARKASVISVIRSLLGVEKTMGPEHPGSVSILDRADTIELNSIHEDDEYVDALDCLDIGKSSKEIEHASAEGRKYLMNPRGSIAQQMPYPIPAKEEQRLEMIKDVGVSAYNGKWDELNLICELAARELNVSTSLIVIVNQEDQLTIAANQPKLENTQFKRNESFCQHTVMDSKPLVVLHPEADVRFNRSVGVNEFGVRYYCGFPLVVGQDKDVVIGSLCCLDETSRVVTKPQMEALEKLSQAAAKIIRIQGQTRRTSVAPPG